MGNSVMSEPERYIQRCVWSFSPVPPGRLRRDYMSFASRDPEREIACGTLETNERVAGLSRAPGERLHHFQGTTLDCSRVVKKGLKERMDHR